MARTDTLGNFLTDVADAIREKKGTTEPINASEFDTEIQNLPSGGGTKMFTGHVDSAGLKQIGWTDEDIQYFQDYGVQWDEESDDSFKLTATELAGDDSANTRYVPKNTTKYNFASHYNLLAIPNINTSTSLKDMFANCYNLTFVPELNVNHFTTTQSMFSNCYSLEKITSLDTRLSTTFNNMFYNCRSLKTISYINTSKATTMTSMFNGCYSLRTIPELDSSACKDIGSMFNACSSLVDFGGLKNIGQAYSTGQSANSSKYMIDLQNSNNLSYQSIMNIINNLYDIKTKGCTEQTLRLGATNLAKITEEEKAIAINKGWKVI